MSDVSVSSDNSIDKTDLLYFFYRVGEPIFFPKGDTHETRYFDVPAEYLPEKYRGKSPQILSRFSDASDGRRIDINAKLDNALLSIPIKQVLVVKRRDRFSLFIPQHQKAAGRLIDIFLGLKTIDDFVVFAAFVYDQVNPQLFVYALSVAILNRPDTRDLKIPPYIEIFPDKFVDYASITDAVENAAIFNKPSDRAAIEIPRDYTGNDGDPEHRLAYFREDIGVNLHHWHWHLIYPFEGPDKIVKKDRRGELFYYMHQQIIARYNVERLCNNLDIVKRLLDLSQPIPEAYFPMMNTGVAGKSWPSRPPNMTLRNINRPDVDLSFDIEDLNRFRERIYEAINRKSVIRADGTIVSLNNDAGIDILGNIVEASVLTPNADYYGDLHNMGHNAIAYIHDPDYQHNQSPGVMSETTTAMRDPVFYRWHSMIDDVFADHKLTLSPYSEKDLAFDGINLTDVEVCSLENNNITCGPDKNILHTYFVRTDIDLSRGLDFTPRGAILVRVTHLSHDQFRYTFKAKNSTNFDKYGTMRIFMAPTLGSANFQINLKEQKRLMIEMDRFVVTLRPGDNTIIRNSTDSSITVPFEQTFRHLEQNRPNENQPSELENFNYCGCGWPQHMLLPKGTTGGYPMILFAMISDFTQDRVDSPGPSGCRTGLSFCGLRDREYPDRRPMGYPFDRPLKPKIDTIDDFLTSNMIVLPINIVHSEVVQQGNLIATSSYSVKQLNRPPGARNPAASANQAKSTG